jgi:hypothetical protein
MSRYQVTGMIMKFFGHDHDHPNNMIDVTQKCHIATLVDTVFPTEMQKNEGV